MCALCAAAMMLIAAKKPKVGDLAPDFELTLVDGSKVTLDQLRGNVVVLNFWATWCVPCRTELPTLDAFYVTQAQNGLKVYTITTEDSLPLFEMKKLFAVMHVGAAKRIKGPYGVLNGVPTNFVIDRNGRVRYAKADAFDLAQLNRIIVPLLKEKPDATTQTVATN
jgi:peroxiredoxin